MGLSILSIDKLQALRKLSCCNVLFQKFLTTAVGNMTEFVDMPVLPGDQCFQSYYVYQNDCFPKIHGVLKVTTWRSNEYHAPPFSQIIYYFPFLKDIPVFHMS